MSTPTYFLDNATRPNLHLTAPSSLPQTCTHPPSHYDLAHTSVSAHIFPYSFFFIFLSLLLSTFFPSGPSYSTTIFSCVTEKTVLRMLVGLLVQKCVLSPPCSCAFRSCPWQTGPNPKVQNLGTSPDRETAYISCNILCDGQFPSLSKTEQPCAQDSAPPFCWACGFNPKYFERMPTSSDPVALASPGIPCQDLGWHRVRRKRHHQNDWFLRTLFGIMLHLGKLPSVKDRDGEAKIAK